MLEVQHITFSYGLRETLGDISFEVGVGEVLAVVGANGAGKTTLLRLLACLLMQDAGNIRLDGIDTLERPVRYRRRIGYLSEKCPLYDEMTVEDYLTYRLRLKGEQSRLRVRRRVDEVVGQCGLIDVRRSVMRVLSQGYRKRVGLADALSTHPGLLLLDDPLAGLDVPQRRQAAEVLGAVAGRSAVVLAGHEIELMLGWCTRVLVLCRGRVAGVHRVAGQARGALLAQIEREMTEGLKDERAGA